MDYAALPPEINSARMYTGPGIAPMTAAASAWNALGAELASTAASYESVIAMLAEEEWRGPASAAMAAAAKPFVAWLSTTATAAEQAAGQAMASAAAYEAAFAMTVPPPVIAANRSALATLVASNFLGQNTAAIAANEALYGQMWVQDAVAMYNYAASSATAGVLAPLSSPAPTTSSTGLAGQAAAIGGAAAGNTQNGLTQLVAGLPNAVQTLASPLGAAAPSAQAGDFLSNFINATQNIGLWNSIQTYSTYGVTAGAWHLFAGIASAIGIGSPGVSVAGAGGAGLVHTTALAPSAAAPVLASVGQAAPVGGLSVPAAWSATAPAAAETATLAGAGWTAPAEAGASVAAVPAGLTSAGATGRGGFGFGMPRYGFKPTVMTRPVVAG